MKNPTDRVQREFVKPFTDYVEPKQDDSDRDRDK